MASSISPDTKLEDELTDVGNKLLNDTSSIVELLSLLDKAENLLFTVEQEPSKLVKVSMLPVMKALMRPELTKHSEIDVRASVASCLHEIMRITAPDAPYEDKVMKEIFELTMVVLKKLSLDSGHCYRKAISILDRMANVRSCLVMLDIEVDELVVEMFHLFFKTIRPDLPESVFLSMETIMTLVIDEIEGLPNELLIPLLLSIRKGNQEISPLACELGEKVFRTCADKLKPYLPEGLRLSAFDVNDYSEIVSKICNAESGKALKVTMGKEPEADSTGSRYGNPALDDLYDSLMEKYSQPKVTQFPDEKNKKPKSYLRSKIHSSKRGRPKKNQDSIKMGDDASKASSGKKKVSFSVSNLENEDDFKRMTSCKADGKRKHSQQKQEETKSFGEELIGSRVKTKSFGEELIGSRVKVWWPMDEMFYEGTVYSYNPVQKKHRVYYDDGEEELLDLRSENWEIVGEKNLLDHIGFAHIPSVKIDGKTGSSDNSSKKKKKKSDVGNLGGEACKKKKKESGNSNLGGEMKKVRLNVLDTDESDM